MTKRKEADDLISANKELAFQDGEKEKRAAELIIANKELVFQNKEKEKRANELVITNKELNQSKKLLQNSLKEVSDYKDALDEIAIIALTDQNGIINKVNSNFCKISKYKEDELIGQDHRILNSGYHSKKFIRNLWETIANGKVWKGEIKNKAKDVTFYWVDTTIVPFLNEVGNPHQYLAIRIDITKRKESEEQLNIVNEDLALQNKEKEKRAEKSSIANYARSLIEASLDPLFTISPEGKITDINQATLRVTKKSREQLIGTYFSQYFTDPDKAKEGYEKVFEQDYVVDYPLTILGGSNTSVLFNGAVYKDNIGNVLGAVVVARDITEQKRFEKELIEAKFFAERATCIAEEAKEKAEDAVTAKQQFLSNMSHEIRTPMNAIIGFTKVMLKTDLTLKQNEYLNAIKVSGDALIVLINDILDLAKVDAGKMTFEQTPFKLSSSIFAILHLFEPKIQEKNLVLIKEYDDNIPNVLVGDPVRLHQIILNLLSNAVKFTTKGSIKVDVRLVNEDKEKVEIEFAVSDTGIGISDEKLDCIFDNFQQGTSETSRLYGGTGLGLSIVKQLVEPQGGTINVISEVGKGTIFSFTLTFQKTNEEVESDVEIVELDEEIKNVKVLVVEDIALNQLLMKTVLDDFGFDKDIASNGKVAIEKLKSNDYDIILMDLHMPQMNGFEATSYIRNTMNLTTPIIALTADVTTVDLVKCKAVGMNDYLAKPIDERVLYNKIVNLLAKPVEVKPVKVQDSEDLEVNKVKCINLAYLNQRTKSDPKLMMEMISLYLEQTPLLISGMRQSYQDRNWKLLYSTVHKMIPSFSIVGIHVDFENMAKKIQDYVNIEQQSGEIHDMIVQIENICNQACIELKEEIEAIKNNSK